MNIILFGAAGFIGKNLTLELAKELENTLILVDKKREFFSDIETFRFQNISIREDNFDEKSDFDELLKGQDIVYHLVSTTVPTTSNQCISQELMANVIVTVHLLEACVRSNIKRIIFFSSGGTVYGKDVRCPITEETPSYPINSYGLQKISIEKLLYLYHYMYGLDYQVIRLSNPYGPYQRPDGILGAVTTFTYKALKGEEIIVYGDGNIVRDFIYIDDAIKAVRNIVEGKQIYHIFNLGCGYGTSIRDVLKTISSTLKTDLKVTFKQGRKTDVPENYLDITRYEICYGKLNPLPLWQGISKTARFMKEYYSF